MEYVYIGNQLRVAETFVAPPPSSAKEATPLAKTIRKVRRALGIVAVTVITLLALLLPLTLWMLSIYLAYNCYRGHTAHQVIGVMVALFFPLMYLLFYLVAHLLMGYPCMSAGK